MAELSRNLTRKPGGARDRFETYLRRADAIVNLLTLGRPVQISDSEIAEMTGMTLAQVRIVREILIHIGAVTWEFRHGQIVAPTWHLRMSKDELYHALDLEMERQMRGGLSPESMRKKLGKRTRKLTRRSQERVAVHEDRLGFAVGAVAGPEPVSPLRTFLKGSGPDAPAALVMAAKQYRATGGADSSVKKAAKLVEELEEIGVAVPPELRQRATVKKDDRLEAIGLVLPYIEDIERQLVVAKDQLRQMADYGSLKQTAARQKQQIERLVAERTAQAMGERPHRS